MADPILPRDLDAAPSVPSNAAIIIDNGVTVQKATPAQVADTARPFSNQAEAEAGTDNAKTMTPLRTAQAIDARGYDGLIDGKEPIIDAGTTGQYYRGDKTWQTLNKAAVGLGSVDNTADADKPVSTAAQAALDGKVTAAAIGISGTATDMGPGGDILTDNADARTWFAELEDAILNTPGTALVKSNASAIGIAPTDANMGTTPGTILSDNGTAKTWFEESEAAIEARAQDDLANVPNTVIANLRGVYSDETLSPGVPFTPNGNPIASLGGCVFNYQSASEDTREISFSVGMHAVTGDAVADPDSGHGDKIAFYAGAYGAPGALNVFSINTSTTIGPGATSVEGAWGYEMDLINQCQDAGNTAGPSGLVTPIFKGFDAVHNGTHHSSAAFITSALASGKWNRGYVATGVRGEAFADYSDATTSLSIYGSHTDILDASNASISGHLIKSDNFNVTGLGEASASQIGVVHASADFAVNISNTLNAIGAGGLSVVTTWGTTGARVMECKVGANDQFWVDGDNANPVNLRVNGVIYNARIYNDGTRNLLTLV